MSGFRVYSPLAPGHWFKTAAPAEYVVRYTAQLAALDAQRVHDQLWELAGGHRPVLLCWERGKLEPDHWHCPGHPEHNPNPDNWCHRRMVALWFEDKLGIQVPEWQPTKRGPGPVAQESLL